MIIMDNIREKLINWFETTFDAIYIIYYTGNEDRLEFLKSELERVGLSNCKNFHWYYDVSSPYDEMMYKDLVLTRPEHEKNNITIKKLSLHHYKISKISYELGYNKILVMEDDICFLNDLELLYNKITNSPLDGDVILYDKLLQYFDKESLEHLYNGNEYLNYTNINVYSVMFASCAMYALSRNGMYERIKNGEMYLCAADDYTNNFKMFKFNTSKKYAIDTNLAIQNTPKYFKQFYDFLDIGEYNVPKVEYKNFIH